VLAKNTTQWLELRDLEVRALTMTPLRLQQKYNCLTNFSEMIIGYNCFKMHKVENSFVCLTLSNFY